MKLRRRQFLQLAAGAVAVAAVSRIARAQTYPVKPVRLIVGFAAGGTFDTLVRLMAQWLSERYRQQFVIENRPGGGGTIGAEAAVRASPDGYTLLLVGPNNAISATLYEKLNFNFIRDIAAVAGILSAPNVMEVNPTVPAKTVPEFITRPALPLAGAAGLGDYVSLPAGGFGGRKMGRKALRAVMVAGLALWPLAAAAGFHLQDATIADIHRAILAKELTATELVRLYLKRIETYNGQCVQGAADPNGFLLGDIEPIEKAGRIGALMTLNIRGKRSKTDAADNDPNMPDALEAARALLKGPLHGIVFAIKDQFDTFDMRSTSGSAAAYANDRPPRDAEVVARLRAAGAIILAKSNMGEYASGDRSTLLGQEAHMARHLASLNRQGR